ncbi:hypothetical protein ACFOLM_14800 [Deinococcus soli (ex Cha et al. 2016)]
MIAPIIRAGVSASPEAVQASAADWTRFRRRNFYRAGRVVQGMSGFSIGSFSFSRSGHGHRGGFLGHHSRSSHSHGRHHYGHGGHYRARRRGPLGCLGVFVVGAALAGGSLLGLVSLLT